MINAIFNGFLKLIIMFIDLISTPINNVINEYLPQLSNVFTLLNQFIDFIIDIIVWVVSWFNFPPYFLTFLIGYYVFKLTVPLLIHNLKILAAWWDTFIA